MLIYIKARFRGCGNQYLMEHLDQLKRYGLFDARVPRYTSYPPANHFKVDVGHHNQMSWLSKVESGSEVSIYIHIPFCKRLCYFCACRTQGTQTLKPTQTYVQTLRQEIQAVSKTLPANIKMSRLHLGGGTPTILDVETMTILLDDVFEAFKPATHFEFSVEIDPTEAARDLIECLAQFGMNRASIGVQDFAPEVQEAIGRAQSFEQTEHVINTLRSYGINNINLDLLYGLPFQTQVSFERTLHQVRALKPDRLAIYGYAHVPWMSKRQVMIKDDTLPDVETRFALEQFARSFFIDAGYSPIGIDHFALPTDGLAKAAQNGTLKRNFQGYTDDDTPTLIGLGASAISKFVQGYAQNATATSAYQERVRATGFAGYKGFELSPQDQLIGTVIEDLMCRFQFRESALKTEFPDRIDDLRYLHVHLMKRFPDLFHISNGGLQLYSEARPLVRIIANWLDTFSSPAVAHASAI